MAGVKIWGGPEKAIGLIDKVYSISFFDDKMIGFVALIGIIRGGSGSWTDRLIWPAPASKQEKSNQNGYSKGYEDF